MDFFDCITEAILHEKKHRGGSAELSEEVLAQLMSMTLRSGADKKDAAEPVAASAPLPSNPAPQKKDEPSSVRQNASENMTAVPPEKKLPSQGGQPGLAELAGCRRCRLCEKRKNIACGNGPENAALLFVGETPGMEEDKTGKAFTGAAGDLLDKMIKAMKFSRSEVYVTHLVKCRPPYSREAEEDEIAQCRSFLDQEIDRIKPKVIVFFGDSNAKALLGGSSAEAMRQQWFSYRNIHCIVTYSPTYLLRHAEAKKAAWSDLQMVMAAFGKN